MNNVSRLFLQVFVTALVLLCHRAWTMTVTVTQTEVEDLPDELKPIKAGGSWFDDMAVERLRQKHKELKDRGEYTVHCETFP